MRWLVIVVASLTTASAQAESIASSLLACSEIEKFLPRLECYDALAEQNQNAPKPNLAQNNWTVQIDTSAFEDTQDVFLSLVSKEAVQCSQFGKRRPVSLYVRCKENTTSIFFTGDCYLASGFSGYGRVDVRIDDGEAFSRSMDASTDNKALGLWRGRTAIPLVKQLLGSERLLLRFTPFNMSPVTTEFETAGLEEVITPLRKSCSW